MILVVGGTGALGSEICRLLTTAGTRRRRTAVRLRLLLGLHRYRLPSDHGEAER